MTKKYIFIDNHHQELTHSLDILFGKRLGYEVVFPIGLDWVSNGFWKIFDHPATANQYLSMSLAVDKTKINSIETVTGQEVINESLEYVYDPTKNLYRKSIQFEIFKHLPIECVIASIPSHCICFRDLIKRYKPDAKLIFQMGNMFSDFNLNGVKNILNSTDRRVPFYKKHVRYSQEFDLTIFKYTDPGPIKRITNLVHYNDEEYLFSAVRNILREYVFESYGAGNSSGPITKTVDVAKKIQESHFIWHLKRGGDGYGHVVHTAAASGRPLIISAREYKGLRFGRFIEDGITCINVDGLTAEQLAKKIRYYSEPEYHRVLCKNIHQRFKELVCFDEDEINVKHFMKHLK